MTERKAGNLMEKLSLMLDGMGCAGCIKNVRTALESLPGVAVENVAVGSAMLAYDPARSSRQAVIEALTKAGYPAREVGIAVAEPVVQNGGHCGLAS